MSERATTVPTGAAASIDPRDADGRTPLFHAARDDRPDLVRHLLAHGADPDAVDRWGLTPPTVAVALDHHEVLVQFLNHGWNPNATPPARRARDASPALARALQRVYEADDWSLLLAILHPPEAPGAPAPVERPLRPLSFAPLTIAAYCKRYVALNVLLNEPATDPRPRDNSPLEPALLTAGAESELSALDLFTARTEVAGDAALLRACLCAGIGRELGRLGLAGSPHALAALAAGAPARVRAELDALVEDRAAGVDLLADLHRLLSFCTHIAAACVGADPTGRSLAHGFAQRLFARATRATDSLHGAAQRLEPYGLKEVANLARQLPAIVEHHVLMPVLAGMDDVEARFAALPPRAAAEALCPIVAVALFDRDELPPWSVLALQRKLGKLAEHLFNCTGSLPGYRPARRVREAGTWRPLIAPSGWSIDTADATRTSALAPYRGWSIVPIHDAATWRALGTVMRNCLVYRDDLIGDCRADRKKLFALHDPAARLISVFLVELGESRGDRPGWRPLPGGGSIQLFKEEAAANRRTGLVSEAAAALPAIFVDELARGALPLADREPVRGGGERNGWERWLEVLGNDPTDPDPRQGERAFRVLARPAFQTNPDARSGVQVPLIPLARSAARNGRTFAQWARRPLAAFAGAATGDLLRAALERLAAEADL